MLKTGYPKPYATLVEGRTKRKLGSFFGLTNFGVNLTCLELDAISALFHHYVRQDEFVYISEGTPPLWLGIYLKKWRALLKPMQYIQDEY